MILHGVFLNIFDTGTLITGASASGKSTLALSLITRNHRLIADDAPEFQRNGEKILGCCPPPLQDFLHVRQLGFLNIRSMFGDQAIMLSQTLNLIVHLQENEHQDHEKIYGSWQQQSFLDMDIPTLTLFSGSPQLAILVETAARIMLNGQMGII